MRDRSIDAAKGIAITLVVMGHVCTGIPWLVKWIYSFHMPIFFMISGYLREGKEYGEFIPYLKRKAISLLYPYYMFAFLSTVGTALYAKDNEILVQTVISRLFGITTENNAIGAIWFLLVLFETEVLDYLIHKSGNAWLVLLCGLFGSVLAIAAIQLPFMLHLSFTAIVFFNIGKQLSRQYINLIDCKPGLWIAIVGLLITNLISMVMNTRVDMYLLQYGNIVLFWIETVSGSMGMLMVILWIGQRYAWKWINAIGQESLIIMAVHSYIHMILCIIIDKLTDSESAFVLQSGIASVGWSGILVALSYVSAKMIGGFFPVLIRPASKKRENKAC